VLRRYLRHDLHASMIRRELYVVKSRVLRTGARVYVLRADFSPFRLRQNEFWGRKTSARFRRTVGALTAPVWRLHGRSSLSHYR